MDKQQKARRSIRLHYAMSGVWALLLVPTLLFWKESVLWVAAMSLYANFVGHLSAAKAARAELESEKD